MTRSLYSLARAVISATWNGHSAVNLPPFCLSAEESLSPLQLKGIPRCARDDKGEDASYERPAVNGQSPAADPQPPIPSRDPQYVLTLTELPARSI